MSSKQADKAERYSEVQRRIEITIGNEKNPVTIMAAVAAILKESFDHFYWVGFLL